jgi:O-antigen/teichoic acid export membrane protein
MLFNALSLVATFVVKSGLGFAYWWFAARRFSPEAVGFASATVTAMTLLGTLCMLGFGTLLIRELPRQPGKAVALISSALLLVAAAGGCIGLLFALGAPSLSTALHPLRANVQAVTLFAGGVSIVTVNLVLDQAFIGLLRGDLQLWRNTLLAGIKLVALVAVAWWLGQRGGLTIYATWVIGEVLSLAILGAFALLKKKWSGKLYLPRRNVLQKLGSSAIQHHLLNILLIGPNMALPVLVTVLISATTNAWFYVAFILADVVYVIPQALVTALYAVSAAQPRTLAHKARLTLGLSLITCVCANVVLWFGSKQLLGLFGPSYAVQGIWSLRFLGLGAFPFLMKDHYTAICRIQDRIAQVLLPMGIGALLEIGLAALGAHLSGVSGLSLGWVMAVCIEALFMSRTLYKIVRPTRTPIDQDQRQPSPSYQHEASSIDMYT